MSSTDLFIDLLAVQAAKRPHGRLEERIVRFLEADAGTEALDGAAFAQVNGSATKADYLLGSRRIVAELKTINADPHQQIEQRLRERFAKPDAPIVFGSVGVSAVTERMEDRDDINKMMVDLAGRAVRRHLKKANEQIGAIKERLSVPEAGGLLILMNDTERMIDASAVAYAIKSAFETVEGRYPHITSVWASIESHTIGMSEGRTGFPQLHVFKSLERQAELEFITRMMGSWGASIGTIERIEHRGRWESMMPVYDGSPPTLSPFS